jgi:hypothetical protein
MPIDYKKDEDFLVRYANNSHLEASTWDLKITFGQTDQTQGQNAVVQHTSITIPWPYAKIFAYMLQAQIVAKECEDGHIAAPANIISPPLQELPDDVRRRLKHPQEGIAAINKLWQKFLEENPEASPETK